jgi:hypothetical protein
MLQVAASGFGKGILITLAVVTVALAVSMGYSDFAKNLPSETGIMRGLATAFQFFGSGLGLATLAIGGTLGAVADTHRRQNAITAEMARQQAQDFTLARDLSAAKNLEVVRNAPPVPEVKAPPVVANNKGSMADSIPECGHCARELERRVKEQQQISVGG